MSVLELLRGTSDGVLAVDLRQRIVFWNDAARRILGFEPESVLGQPCYEVLCAKDESGGIVCEKRCASFRASLRGELSLTRDVQARTSPGGRKWISLTTSSCRCDTESCPCLAHVFRNTSELHGLKIRQERESDGAEVRGEPRRPPVPPDRLTDREKEVLRLLASGSSTKSICARLGVETTTARTHVQHVLAKLGVHSRLEAVAYALHNGLLRSTGE